MSLANEKLKNPCHAKVVLLVLCCDEMPEFSCTRSEFVLFHYENHHCSTKQFQSKSSLFPSSGDQDAALSFPDTPNSAYIGKVHKSDKNRPFVSVKHTSERESFSRPEVALASLLDTHKASRPSH